MTSYLASTLVLMLLPLAAWRVDLLPAKHAVALLVGTWCVYHLLEYLATVALWSWLADLVPRRIRGRFLGRRERWMVLGQAAAMIVAGLHTWGWLEQYPHLPRPTAYALPALVGAVVMALSILPLAAMASVPTRSLASIPLRRLLAPLTDPRFRRLLLFGCWFSFFNGVTQSAQGMFPYRVLGVGMFTMLLLKTGMRTGQWSLGPWVGRVADRIGNRPVMLLTLPIVAAGPLCYLFAGRASDATVAGVPLATVWLTMAWVAWIAYVGLNVCLPNLMLNLAPREDNTPHIAGYYALTGLLTALATLTGGWLFDRFEAISWTAIPGTAPLDIYQCSFLVGWLTRTAGLILLWRIVEPRRNSMVR